MRARLSAGLLVALAACARPEPPPLVAPSVVAIAAPAPAPAPAPAESAAVGTPDEPFRQLLPAPRPIEPFVPPPAVRAHLRNGIPVVLVSQPSLYSTIIVVALGGLTDVDAARPDRLEVADEMLSAMLLATKNDAAWTIADRFAVLGMPRPSWSMDRDAVDYSATVRVDNFAKGVKILADVVLQPSFKRESFERSREQDARWFDYDLNDAGKVADRIMEHSVYGAHPYGSFVNGRLIRGVTLADVIALHARVFDPSRLSIVVTGQIAEKDAVSALEDAFGAAPPVVRSRATFLPSVGPSAGGRIVVVDKPGAPTAAISVGFSGPWATASDEDTARMAINILMNSAVGRGGRHLRDELKLVPWTEVLGEAYRAGGLLGWRTQAPTDQVATVLAEADRMTRALAAQGPTGDELDVMRDWMGSLLFSAFETPAKAARVYAELVVNGLPEEALVQRPTRLLAVTADDVRAAASRYLDHERMRVVVVGDLAGLRAPLSALGWGPIEVRDATGAVVRPGPAPQAAR